jgi:crotonobetainyl-CoA:carnitine CoA-transferase CaiB-like acyl-CoA transferase
VNGNRPGPLDGIRVVELASELGAPAAKMLGDLGADVVVVEPPGGAATRAYGPFVDDEPGPDRSLFWWYYNTSKRSVVLDLDDAGDRARFTSLVAAADVVVEGEQPGRLGELGIAYGDLAGTAEQVVWATVTPYGSTSPRSKEPWTDLTILAAGGPVWCCGYDDHSFPPVRGGGNQAAHTASLWAVEGVLAALVWRDRSGRGQHIDVSAHAAVNVTTEAATYEWLVAGQTVQRQTARHAAVNMTMPTHALGTDGRYVNTGVPPRTAREFQALLDLLDELGLRDEFHEAVFLERGVERGEVSFAEIFEDAEVMAIIMAGRAAMELVATYLPADEFFRRMQDAGMACGVMASPEEVMDDEHFIARGFPVEIDHDELGRPVVYPGAPFVAHGAPWRISRRPPLVGEHQDEVFGDGLGS